MLAWMTWGLVACHVAQFFFLGLACWAWRRRDGG